MLGFLFSCNGRKRDFRCGFYDSCVVRPNCTRSKHGHNQMSSKNHSLRKNRFVRMQPAFHFLVLASFVALLPALLHGEATSVQVPSATPLSVQLLQHVPMKAGEPLEGRLLYPVYVDNRVAIPAGSKLYGSVIRLNPDRSRRIHSDLRGDFTPFHIPVVRFDRLVLPDGAVEAIASDRATDGVPILRLSTPAAKKRGSFIRREIAQGKQKVKDTVALVTAPGRGDRLVQFIYTQLPYHPERIEGGTLWTVELAKPLNLELAMDPPEEGSQIADHENHNQPGRRNPDPGKPAAEQEQAWQLHAYLNQTISSGKEKPGDTFQARIAQPVFNAQHILEVPEGALLIGEITQSKPARSFARQGKLRFDFRELRFPSGFTQPVEGVLAGVDANKSANLQIDSEGGIQPKPQNRMIVPLALTLLAGRAFDNDGSQAGNGAVASNGFGIVGRITGIVASSRNVAAGIGIYGAALSFYDRWLTRGHNVVFVKDTRIEVTTTPVHGSLLAPGVQQR